MPLPPENTWVIVAVVEETRTAAAVMIVTTIIANPVTAVSATRTLVARTGTTGTEITTEETEIGATVAALHLAAATPPNIGGVGAIPAARLVEAALLVAATMMGRPPQQPRLLLLPTQSLAGEGMGVV